MEWIDLAPVWDHLTEVSEKRDQQKSRYRSTKNWSTESTHFVGCCGEYVIERLSGLSFDRDLNPLGDNGNDFIRNGKSFSVKTTKYWREPHLKEYMNPKKWCDFYILVGLDVAGKRARAYGWTSGETMQNAELINYGYGDQRVVKNTDLNPGLPPELTLQEVAD